LKISLGAVYWTRLEPLKNKSKQEVVEELYAGYEKMGPLLDEIRTCLLKAA
jgi:hypothetical protein